jgi:hypothetical protein
MNCDRNLCRGVSIFNRLRFDELPEERGAAGAIVPATRPRLPAGLRVYVIECGNLAGQRLGGGTRGRGRAGATPDDHA